MKLLRWLFLTGLAWAMASCGGGSQQFAFAQSCVANSQVTLSGTLRSANGLPSSNDVITMTPSQQGYIAGCGVVVPTANTCATSTDGSVVGLPNPLSAIITSTTGVGTLASGTYYVVIAFYDAAGNTTLTGPETIQQLSVQGSLVVNAPVSGIPAGAVGMRVYIGTATGAETLQSSTTGNASYNRSTPLTAGTGLPTTNSTICKLTANDSIWPVGTGYVVSLIDSSGNAIPSYPMQWQLMGAGTTIDLSNGLPYYHGVVMYPSPILASPAAHGPQSISGPLGLGGYNITNVGKIGVGTSLPAYPVDVRNGFINTNLGYLINGSAGTSGQCILSGGVSGPDTWGNCLTSIPTLHYQTVSLAGVDQTQSDRINFIGGLFTAAFGASPSRTDIGLVTTGTEGNLVTAAAAGTSGHCAQWDASGGVGDAGSSCAGPATIRTCNANGCYRIEADGTIEQWGVSSAAAAGPTTTTVTVIFPTSFTTTANLSVQGMADNCADTCAGKNPVAVSGNGTLSTSGITFSITGVVPTGGGGASLLNALHVYWHAMGN